MPFYADSVLTLSLTEQLCDLVYSSTGGTEINKLFIQQWYPAPLLCRVTPSTETQLSNDQKNTWDLLCNFLWRDYDQQTFFPLNPKTNTNSTANFIHANSFIANKTSSRIAFDPLHSSSERTLNTSETWHKTFLHADSMLTNTPFLPF